MRSTLSREAFIDVLVGLQPSKDGWGDNVRAGLAVALVSSYDEMRYALGRASAQRDTLARMLRRIAAILDTDKPEPEPWARVLLDEIATALARAETKP
jgi:hypothetical protein